MYPNLYYVLKDWFNVDWPMFSFLNTFGLMVAISFVAAAYTLTLELKRKEKQGLLTPRDEWIVVGKPASAYELFTNALLGFIFGYKLLGILFLRMEDTDPQQYIFSSEGSMLGGLIGALLLGGLKWYDKQKQVLKQPERRTVRIWPHDRVGDIVILALIFGILGAKLFDAVENWDAFVNDPIGVLFTASGLTFYGGLILAAIAIVFYASRKGIKVKHLVDAAAPGLMLAYAIGRLGCQISGDGDWGIYNSAYTADAYGNVSAADPKLFESRVNEQLTYFIEGAITDSTGRKEYVTDRTYPDAASVPHAAFKGPDFLPVWLFAYAYPGNVNKDGYPIPGDVAEHNRVLPEPVYPTPLYEFVFGSILFLILWKLRTRIQTPVFLFGLYLVFNGFERFIIEKIRVNKVYHILGFESTQSELVAIMLMIGGVLVMVFSKRFFRR